MKKGFELLTLQINSAFRRQLRAAAIYRMQTLSQFVREACVRELCRAKRDGLVIK